MEKRNIFLVSNMYPNGNFPYYGIFVKNFQDMFSKSNYNINCKAVIKGKRNNRIKKIFAYFLFILEIFIKGFCRNYQIVYVHYFKYSIFPTYCLKILFPQKKLIYNFHGSDLIKDNEDTFVLSSFKIKALKLADAIVVPSNYYKDLIVHYCKPLRNKIFVSPSGGINSEIFYPNENFDFKNQLKLGYIGRLDIRKGVETFVKSLLILKKNNCFFKASIIGTGTLLQEYKIMIKELELENDILILPPTDQKSLREYYSNFDLFIFPTYRKSESLGLVGLEALTCGTPVIGSKIGEIQHYVKNGINGYLFEPKNELDLSKKIIEYSELTDNKKKNMRDNSVNFAQEYSSENVKKEMIIFLDSLFQKTII